MTLLQAPAKLTLTLRILDKREDGFNNLEAFTVFLGNVYDELSWTTHDAQEHSFIFDETGKSIPPEQNLVIRAVRAYEAHEKVVEMAQENQAIRIALKKTIPLSSGLGGGSVDAAAALHAANGCFGNLLSLDELAEIAQQLGSDVPACVYSNALWMKGRGETIEDIDAFSSGNLDVLVMTPTIECSTPDVYRHYEEMGRPADIGIPAPGQLTKYISNLHNDLALAAYDLYPGLHLFKQELENTTGRPFQLAGSGSTLFSLGERQELEKTIESARGTAALSDVRLCAISAIQ